MFNLICKASPSLRSSFRTSPTHKLFFLQDHPLSSSGRILKSVANTSNEHSFTVCYLINSCGFPPEKALAASKYMNFETPNKPDSVLAFFRNHGFTETQISNLVRGSPPVLLCNPEKTLLPKFQFFTSEGVSSTDLTKILTRAPSILKRSLENQIIPSFHWFKNLLQSRKRTISAMKRNAEFLCHDFQTNLVPKINILRDLGVPESNIVVLLIYHAKALWTSTERFKDIVHEVKEMGFNPRRMKFIRAIHTRKSMSKSTWEKKVELYKKWGWSMDEIVVAFGKNPWCMSASKDKITGVMDYLINNVGLETSVVAQSPIIISYSLEKRIVPRCSVYQVLVSKGLVRKDFRLTTMFNYPENKFVRHIENSYEKEAPELLKLYQEILDRSK
ncbi:unnamed protein product [Ilex paraguariensis]|uniref:Uncharacterized protein n=1 Tax=Ilex paraguariensis TaxID=185542 RepID=A0ABC8RU70_9AQUA